MLHKQMLEDMMGNDVSTCDGELEYVTSCFAADVYWVIYRCRKCGKFIWTVEGRRHWWNTERDAL